MKPKNYDIPRLINPKGRVFPQAVDLYAAVLGHEKDRKEHLREVLDVSPRHFAEHLKLPASQPNKTMRNFSKHVLGNMAKNFGVAAIIVPLNGTQITVKEGSAIVLDENTPPPGWNEAKSVLEAYGESVVRLTNAAVRECRIHDAADSQSLAVVGSVAILCVRLFLHWKHTVQLRLSHAHSFAPIICNNRTVTPLDRYFRRRANLDEDAPATAKLLWCPGQLGDAKNKQLQRWRLGKI